MSLGRKIAHAKSILRDAVEEHQPVSILAGFSGGHDSLVATHLTMQVYPGAKAFHANTGIGVEKTREFVRETCEYFNWPLVEIRAKEDCGQDYDQLVIEQGFPGPGLHYKMYQRLKERPVRLAVAREKTNRMDRVMIATGIRKDESQRRMGYDSTIVDRIGSQVWVNPIFYFTSADKQAYIDRFDLPRNPVVETLGMSGECKCGAYAHKGELDLTGIVDPGLRDRILALQDRVHEAGWPWGWEEGPSRAMILEKHGQINAFAPMCVGCEKMHTDMELS